MQIICKSINHLLIIDEKSLEIMKHNGRSVGFISVTVEQQETAKFGALGSVKITSVENFKTWDYPRINAHDSFLNSSRI